MMHRVGGTEGGSFIAHFLLEANLSLRRFLNMPD
jgi:hypothetical protein